MIIKVKKAVIILLCMLIMWGSFPVSIWAYEEYDLSAIEDSAVYITELNSGEILIEQNSGERMYPGSITKIMTVMVALDTLSDLEEEVTVTEDALSYLGYNSSVAGLEAGEVLSVSELISATLIPSGNDAAIVLAIFVGGKICSSSDAGECYDAFLDKMNEKAAYLGMRDSHFNNADGYDDYDNYSTAYDIVILGKAAMKYEVITKTVAKQQVVISTNKGEHSWKTTNVFYYSSLPEYYGGGENPYYNDWVTGMKTGYTDIGQKCFLMTAQGNGMDLVGAVLNVDDSDNMRIWRNVYGMLEYIIKGHTLTKLAEGEKGVYDIKISNPAFLQSPDFRLFATHEGLSCVPNEYLENMNTRIEYNPEICTLNEKGKVKLISDVEPMDKLATMVFYSGDEVFYEIDMVAVEAYDKFDLFDLALYVISSGFVVVIIIAVIRAFRKPKRKRRYARKRI